MNVSLIIGVDPGASGAISFLQPNGALFGIEDIPVDRIQVGKHSRSRVNIPRLWGLLQGLGNGTAVFIEKPNYRPMMKRNPKTGVPEPMQMGVAGAGAFGETYGSLLAALVIAGAQIHEVAPGVWGRAIGLKGGKDDAIRLAGNLFPASAKLFARKMDHNRAEAALIGYYGAQKLRGEGHAVGTSV